MNQDSHTPPSELLSLIESRLDRKRFQDHHWSGSFWDYLALAITQVLRYGASEPSVVVGLLDLLAELARVVGSDRQSELIAWHARIVDAARCRCRDDSDWSMIESAATRARRRIAGALTPEPRAMAVL